MIHFIKALLNQDPLSTFNLHQRERVLGETVMVLGSHSEYSADTGEISRIFYPVSYRLAVRTSRLRRLDNQQECIP